MGKILLLLSLACLGGALVSLIWAALPAATDEVKFIIPAGVLPGSPSGRAYASQTDYTLTVTWHTWLRLGEVGEIRVALREANPGGNGAGRWDGQVVVVEPIISKLPLDPPGRVQTNLVSGKEMGVSWTMSPLTQGDFSGKIVVAFSFFDDSLKELVPVPVAVVDVALRVTALWGQERTLVTWFGVIGLVLWGLLTLLRRTLMH